MSDGSLPRRAAEIDVQPAGSELLVHDLRSAQVHVLNATAAKVFALCDGEHTVDAIVDAVAAEFDAERATVAADVATVLANFRDLGLTQSSTAPA